MDASAAAQSLAYGSSTAWVSSRWAGLIGLGAAVLFFVGFALLAADPHFIPPGATDEEVADAIAEPAGLRLWLALFAEICGSLLYFGFALILAARVGSPQAPIVSIAIASAAALQVAVGAVAVAAEYALAIGSGGDLSVDGAKTIHAINAGAYMASWGFMALFLLVTGAALYASRALPRWLAWLAFGIAGAILVGLLSPETIGQVAANLAGLWFLAAAITILVGSKRRFPTRAG